MIFYITHLSLYSWGHGAMSINKWSVDEFSPEHVKSCGFLKLNKEVL